jgi:hypothetical protein
MPPMAVSLITATRGERGRWHGVPLGQHGHPGREAVGAEREAELRRAAAVLSVQDASTPPSRNSISNRRSTIGFGWRISWCSR